MPTITRPSEEEYASYFGNYISKVAGENAFAVLETAAEETVGFLKEIPTGKWDESYAPGKWTLKESLMHLLDSERIFAYRALRIARNDMSPLPGFEQDDYVPHYHATERSPESVIAEYKAIRQATLELFRYLPPEALARKGTASGMPFSVRALAYVIAGHEIHHINLIQEKYLNK